MKTLLGMSRDDIKRLRVTFALAICAGIVARGAIIFNPFYSIDGYGESYAQSYSIYYKLALSQGRYGFLVLMWLRDAIGCIGIETANCSLILSTIVLSAAAVLFSLVIYRRISAFGVLIFVAIFSLHPFMTELFHFSSGTLNLTIPIFLAAAGLAVIASNPTNWLRVGAGIMLNVTALSIYQTAGAYAIVAALLAIVAAITDLDQRHERVRIIHTPEVRILLAILASVALYLVSIYIVSIFTGVKNDGRTDLLGLLDIGLKFKVLTMAVAKGLWPQAGVIPHPISVLLIILIGMSVGIITWPLLIRGEMQRAFFCIVVIATALCGSVGLTSVGTTAIWLVPRMLSPVAVFAAGMVMLGWRLAPTGLKKPMALAVLILVVGYVGSSNRIIFDQRRTNLWDFQEANRIVARLETHSQFRTARKIAIVGGAWCRSSPLSTTWGDMNVSALSVPWAKLGLIEQATGYRFSAPEAADTKTAEDYCSSAPFWPADRAVSIIGDVAVVCLPKT